MDCQHNKCVMVVDGSLPIGVIANAAAIMGITLGKKRPELVGSDAADQSGVRHPGIIEIPVPILQGSPQSIRAIREKASRPDFFDVDMVDFSDLAQGCRTYQEFIRKMGSVSEDSLRYLGLALCGEKKKIDRLTGNMPLLR